MLAPGRVVSANQCLWKFVWAVLSQVFGSGWALLCFAWGLQPSFAAVVTRRLQPRRHASGGVLQLLHRSNASCNAVQAAVLPVIVRSQGTAAVGMCHHSINNNFPQTMNRVARETRTCVACQLPRHFTNCGNSAAFMQCSHQARHHVRKATAERKTRKKRTTANGATRCSYSAIQLHNMWWNTSRAARPSRSHTSLKVMHAKEREELQLDKRGSGAARVATQQSPN
jgi:hypothetical protein